MPDLLTVNNIEVIYDHVILVLKGVSLSVPEGGVVALLGAQRGWQDHHAESHHAACAPCLGDESPKDSNIAVNLYLV